MPRAAVDDNKRMNLRLRPEQKATLMRAAALRHTGLTDFVLQPALREAQAAIEESERIVLSERDSLLVMKLLENRLRRMPSFGPPSPRCRNRRGSGCEPSRLARRADLEKA
jgi:uncharacterized protein (DUF1778 family)